MKKTKNMVFLYVPWVFDRLGGVDIVVDNLYFSLKEQAVNVVIAEQSWIQSGSRIDADGRCFENINFPIIETNTGLLATTKSFLSFVKYFFVSLYALQRKGVTVINAHYPSKNMLLPCLFKASKLWRGRVVLSFHGSDVNGFDPQDGVWRFIVQTADEMTVCSHALKAKLLDRMEGETTPVTVVHNGINCNWLRSLSAGVDDKRPFGADYIVCLANFVEMKGQEVLVEAFATVVKAFPDIKLVLAGGKDNGTWARLLRKRCRLLNIDDKVHLLFDVPHEEVPSLLTHARCLVLPTRAEAFGLVVAEAGLMGTPVIASNIGGIPEIISSPDLGVLVPVGDSLALSEAVLALLAHPERGEILGHNLRQRICEEFTIERMSAGYSNVIFGNEE